MIANILPAELRPPDPVGQNSTFTEHAHSAYQIKGNKKRGSRYFNHRPPPLPIMWGGVKFQPFQNMVMLHIRLKGIEQKHHASTISLLTHTGRAVAKW